MAPVYLVAVTTVLLCWTLVTPSATAVRRQSGACCTSYNRKPIAFRLIKGFKEQSTLENCHLNAVIFFTTRNKKICTSTQDPWVKEALAKLSSKLKKMSKPNAAPGTAKARTGRFLESGPFLNANRTSQNLTNTSGTFSANRTFLNANRTFLNANRMFLNANGTYDGNATTLSDDY